MKSFLLETYGRLANGNLRNTDQLKGHMYVSAGAS